MATVIYAPDADDDLKCIVDYVARDKPKAARDWLAKIRETCETCEPPNGHVRYKQSVI